MPEEEFSLTPKQQEVLARLAQIQQVEQQEIIDAIAMNALIAANKPEDDPCQ